MSELARKIRILVATTAGLDDDRGARLVARALADAGHEVVYAGLGQTPAMIAAAALHEAVDAVGLTIAAGAHPTVFPAVIEALAARGVGDTIVFGVGAVPAEDVPALTELGVARMFTPAASCDEIVAWIAADLREAA